MNIMKKSLSIGIFAALLGSAMPLTAQQTFEVDRTKYTDYTDTFNPDWSLMTPQGEAGAPARANTRSQRPDHVHNGKTRHFPPVFNQDGGSCGSASRISYMFSYELAAYRNLDGSDPNNYYPSHFVWLHTNSPSQGKEDFVTKVGVPSAATYGGQTYSALFGYQEESNNDFGWMQGYDKWYEAMHNRMLQPSNFPVNVGTEEGREAVKNWLWNHNGDDSFAAGGICGIGVASGGDWQNIPKTENNQKIGVAGMKYVKKWGTTVDHALTIVGYDDRIEFDLDGDGIYGERSADELGAWIIVNSWGDGWCNGGFIYCPYAHAVPAFNSDGTVPNNFWAPEIYRVRKDYRPLRTIKLEMDYSRRSEIALSAGVSADLNATEPDQTIPFVHFTYAGDGNGGNSNPAPEVPMLGRWADGRLHTEPMEFGYDLTDLSAGFDMSRPLKYFFIVDSRSWAQGEGTIHGASIIDYRTSELGVETPFAVGEGIEIRNAGEKTIISVIVQGSGHGKPQNVAFSEGSLSWQAPLANGNEVESYNIYYNGTLITTLPASTCAYSPEEPTALGEYGVSAVYADGTESEQAVARVPLAPATENVGVHYDHAGFTIPNVMATRHENATIEFWIKPSSLDYWNQSGGAGLTTFFFYATGHGQYSAGWNNYDYDDYASTYNAPLQVGKWSHIAIVVAKNKMTIYVDGLRLGSCESSKYSGLGGFGNLVFAAGDGIAPNGAQHATYDEVRIWSVARTPDEIKKDMYTQYTGSTLPQGLLTYLRGDIITDAEGQQCLYDYAGGHHATLQGYYEFVGTDELNLQATTAEPSISIDTPTSTIYAGIPTTFTATYNSAVDHITWTAAAAGIEEMHVASPTMTFAKAGTHTVTATATTADGRSASATLNITVAEAPEVDATFTTTASEVPAGARVSFHAANPIVGYTYQWSMPGATIEQATAASTSTSYPAHGTYTVTLTATAPNGTSRQQSQRITVVEVAPKAVFSLAPSVVLKGETIVLRDESLYTPLYRKWHLSNENMNYIVYADADSITIDRPGVYDVTLEVSNNAGAHKTKRERALVVANADSKNGLRFSSDEAMITVAEVPFTPAQNSFTIDWWMNADWTDDNTNAIGDSEETMLLKTMSGGRMQLFVSGSSVITIDGFIIPGEWHHYAVTFAKSNTRFYRDGKLFQGPLSVTTSTASVRELPELKRFRIGGADAPFRGRINELRIWGKRILEEQYQTYANEPISDVAKAESTDQLALYYDFNQSGGAVIDATSKGRHGERTGFGPDGDAWGLSSGVFSLDFSGTTSTDITAKHLTNYAKSFKDNGKCINPTLASRTFALTDWTLENTVTEGSTITGAHVDRGKSSCFTVTTGWDNFATSLVDHKVFQTITLPAGCYTFIAEYGTYEGQCGGSYLVAAAGNTLPDSEQIDEALGYTAMKPKGSVSSNSMTFILAEETTLSIGLVVNMSGNSCMALQKFILKTSPMATIGSTETIPSGIAPITTAPATPKGIYDLMGRQLRRNSMDTHTLAPGIYIIDGRKVVIK